MKKLGILGVGKMGGAILEGILKKGLYEKEEILLFVHSEIKYSEYKMNGYQVTMNQEELYEECETILLSIKPQMFPEVLEGAKSRDFRDRTIISIAAGLSISYISTFFENAFVVRAMPNTPAAIGMGVTTVCSLDEHRKEFRTAMDILSSIGSCYVIQEDQMDDSLALNGSMPAYLFLFAKAFIDDATACGIDPETAKSLTLNSIIASAELALRKTDSLDTLISNVCSKGGTTIAGLDKLKEGNFEEIIQRCARACADRSRELSK